MVFPAMAAIRRELPDEIGEFDLWAIGGKAC
jgi:hypothetical protein